jgi:hypothetical protein
VKDKDFVVEPNNPRALAENIILALGDDELVKKAPFGCKSIVAKAKHWMVPIR